MCNKAGVCSPNKAIWAQGEYELKPKWDKLWQDKGLRKLVRKMFFLEKECLCNGVENSKVLYKSDCSPCKPGEHIKNDQCLTCDLVGGVYNANT